MKKIWKYLRWIFPPFYLYLALLYLYRGVKFLARKVWVSITYPFRKIKSLFSRESKRRFKGSNFKGELWATRTLLAAREEVGRRPYTMDDFMEVWRDKQHHTSYISAETIAEVGHRNGFTLEEMVFLLCNPLYEWHWTIDGWLELLDYYGAADHKSHCARGRDTTHKAISRDYNGRLSLE